MRYIFVLFSFVVACNNEKKPTTEEKVYSPEIEAEARRRTDSILNSITSQVRTEQKKKAEIESPVKVTNVYLSEDEYGSTDIVVTLKNTTDKIIDGIKIAWELKDNFGDPVKENEAGIIQENLRPGKSITRKWNLYSTTAKKANAFAYEVHFKDGGKWSVK